MLWRSLTNKDNARGAPRQHLMLLWKYGAPLVAVHPTVGRSATKLPASILESLVKRRFFAPMAHLLARRIPKPIPVSANEGGD